MNQAPIFIGGAHKSGTTLLRSLLSDHPELFAIPFETMLPEMLGWRVDIPYRRRQARDLDAGQVRRSIIDWVRFTNEQRIDPLSDNQLLGRMDMGRFEAALRINATDLRSVGEAVFMACHEGLFASPMPPGRRVVEKSVVDHAFAREFRQAWPGCALLHVVRDPYAHFVSFRRYKQRSGGYPLLAKLIGTLKVHFETLERNLEEVPGYLMVRYEDLVLDRERTMRALAGRLGIPWDRNLLVPTKTGRSWQGNSSRVRDAEAGVDLDAWRSEITMREVALIDRHLGAWIDRFGYERFSGTARSSGPRDPGAGLVRSLRNRLWALSA